MAGAGAGGRGAGACGLLGRGSLPAATDIKGRKEDVVDLATILREGWERKSSDVFIKEKSPPCYRVHGRVSPSEGAPLTADDTQDLAYSVLTADQIARFEMRHELDLAFTLEGVCRVRANIYQQQGSVGMVLRLIPLAIYSLDDLALPPVLKDLCRHRQGLILVTGPTGCGKSTTLAAMIDQINSTRTCNIITIEDPIEFVHSDKLGIVNQREVGIDTDSFTDALKYVVRQSPDVILIGEMRDVETMTVALAASETGHLVFSTVHTTSAAETLDRIINMFPPHDKPQICMRMANSLRGILSQKLIPRADSAGRLAAIEIMIATPTVSKLVEEGRSGQIYTAIAEGSFWGMQTMNQCLGKYFKNGWITEEEALINAGNLTELKQLLRRS
ncbi:MAG: type IV pilus twitching motility protein PilT [Armatimonadetes bacterium]|nr:type IV pilus twitching motility protein PilT [Armatimonadota bacterium]